MDGSIQRIDCQPAQQLGIKVGRLLRHHIAGERDIAQLVERNGLDQEGKSASPACTCSTASGASRIKRTLPSCVILSCEPKNTVQQKAVQLHHVELCLPRGNACQRRAMASGLAFSR